MMSASAVILSLATLRCKDEEVEPGATLFVFAKSCHLRLRRPPCISLSSGSLILGVGGAPLPHPSWSSRLQWLVALSLIASLTQAICVAQTVVRCESTNGQRKYCRASTAGGVALRYQYSSEGCWKDDTWGYDGGGIWVTNGCRADFTLGAAPRQNTNTSSSSNDKLIGGLIMGGLAGLAIGTAVANRNNNNNNYYNDYRNTIRCESNDMKYRRCGGNNIRYAEIARQFSGSPCQFNRTWGYSRSFIWVDRGCRAEFWVR